MAVLALIDLKFATGGSIFPCKPRKPKPTNQQVYNDIKMLVIPWAKGPL